MVHVDPATLRRYPILGVLLGLVATVAFVFVLRSGAGEARALIQQKAPVALSPREAVHQDGIRWVTVTGGRRRCEQAMTIPRQGMLERWARGPVASTEVPITSDEGRELLVASFDGAVSCAEVTDRPLTGVIGSTEVFTSRDAVRRWSGTGKRVAVLHVGASPSEALFLFLFLVALLLVSVGFSGYYLKLMLQSRDRDPAFPSMAQPIEPR